MTETSTTYCTFSEEDWMHQLFSQWMSALLELDYMWPNTMHALKCIHYQMYRACNKQSLELARSLCRLAPNYNSSSILIIIIILSLPGNVTRPTFSSWNCISLATTLIYLVMRNNASTPKVTNSRTQRVKINRRLSAF